LEWTTVLPPEVMSNGRICQLVFDVIENALVISNVWDFFDIANVIKHFS